MNPPSSTTQSSPLAPAKERIAGVPAPAASKDAQPPVNGHAHPDTGPVIPIPPPALAAGEERIPNGGDPMADFCEREAAYRKVRGLSPDALVFIDQLYTKEEQQASAQWQFDQLRQQAVEIENLAPRAHAAMKRIADACRHKTGQSYKLRALIYSLWNGKPADLSDILCLDRALREALLDVMRVFGSSGFFYDEVENAFKRAGLREWFRDEHKVARGKKVAA